MDLRVVRAVTVCPCPKKHHVVEVDGVRREASADCCPACWGLTKPTFYEVTEEQVQAARENSAERQKDYLQFLLEGRAREAEVARRDWKAAQKFAELVVVRWIAQGCREVPR